MQGLEAMIQRLDPKLKVLDVGAWGLKGENTSKYIEERFSDVTYMNIKQYDNVTLVADFYKYKFKEKFDLIIMDMNIENNILKDWSMEGLERCKGLLNKGGMLINYIMATDEYGDPDKTPALIRKRWKEFWGTDDFASELVGEKLQNIPGYELFIHEQEKRRPEITWVALKKNE